MTQVKKMTYDVRNIRHVIVEIREGWKVPIPLPDWATHVTMDEDGSVCCYETRPTEHQREWDVAPGVELRLLVTVQDPERYDWRECIVEVPE